MNTGIGMDMSTVMGIVRRVDVRRRMEEWSVDTYVSVGGLDTSMPHMFCIMSNAMHMLCPRAGAIWRLITPIFLHAGIIHITSNLFFQVRGDVHVYEHDVKVGMSARVYTRDVLRDHVVMSCCLASSRLHSRRTLGLASFRSSLSHHRYRCLLLVRCVIV